MRLARNFGLRRARGVRSGGSGGGGSSYVGAVANNTLMPTGIMTVTSTKISQITIHQTANTGGINDIRLCLAKAYFSGSKLIPLPNNYTVNEASIRLVSGGTVGYLTKGGATSWTVTKWNGLPSDTVLDKNDLFTLPANIPANTPFYIFLSVSGSGGTSVPSSNGGGSASSLHTDEACQTDASAPATFTTSVTNTDANLRTRLGALTMIEATRTGDVWGIIGDSQVGMGSSNYGATDGQIPTHNRGHLPYTVANAGFDYVNIGLGGDQWETRLYDMQMQREIIASCTGVIDAYGINSFNNKGQSAAATPLTLAQRALPYYNGKKVIHATTTPQTTGAWTLADGSDQAVKSYAAALVAYNAGLTFGGMLPAPIDVYSALQGATNKWVANGTVKYASVDGLHVSKVGVTTIVPAALTSWMTTNLPLVPVLTGATQPSAALTMTGSPTWAGGKLTNGTATCDTVVPGQLVASIILKITLGASVSSLHGMMPNLSTGLIKQLNINTTGLVGVAGASSSNTPTIPLNFSAENEVMLTFDGTNIYLFVNGVFDSSVAAGYNGTTNSCDFKIVANSAKNISIRELTVWNTCLQTSGSYTPALFAGTESGCVVRWPLATDGSAVLGPVMPA